MAEMAFDEQYQEPFDRSLARFREQLTPTRCGNLKRDGFIVIDDFLGRGWALALLQEMRWLHKHGWVVGAILIVVVCVELIWC